MLTDRHSIAGDTAIVTGASSGIGRAIAEVYAEDGVNVVVCSRSQENVAPVAEAINTGDYDGSALAVECDVVDRDAVDSMVETAILKFGDIDVLVNNAGASFVADFEDISENGWQTVVDINLNGTFHCTQAAGEVMRANGGGTVINIASIAGQSGSARMSHYGAAKAGIINFTRSLAHEWAKYDIRVNCIAPGLIATPGVASQLGITATDIERESADRTIGVSEEIADVAQFLASPAASYILGETIAVAGKPDLKEASSG